MNRFLIIFIIFIAILFIGFPLIKKRLMFLSSKKYLYEVSSTFFIDNIACLIEKSVIQSDKLILFSHGNGGNITYYSDLINVLKEYGDVLIYDYPGYGESLGSSTETSVLESGVKVCKYALEKNYKKIILYGFSLGGAVTIHIASNIISDKIIGLVLQSTFFNMQDCIPFLGDSIKKYLLKEFRSSEKIGNIKYPICILHSVIDKVVPYSSSKKLYDLVQSPKIFYTLDNMSHNDIILDKKPITNSVKFLETCDKYKIR